MRKITVTLTPEDVATLREVFHLALVQSEASVEEAREWSYSDEEPDAGTIAIVDAHSAVCRLMARIDAMLPDSTGFFDSPDLSGAVAAIRADMAEDGATDPAPYLDPEALAMYGVTVAEVRAALRA